MAELEEATPLQLEAMKKEGKTRAQLEKICCLYRFHYEENQSPTRERNLKKFSQRVDKVRKRLILILYIKGTTKITKQSSAEPTVDEIGEEEKESSDLGLIPYYFFEEKDDSDTDLSFQFHEIAKVIVNDFVKKNFVKLSEESLKQVQLTLTHKLLMGNCSSSIMNSSRCLFDRGKYKLNFDSKLRSPYFMGFQFLDRLYREIVQKLVYQSGYQSNGFSGDSIDCMLANEDFITTACYMFGKILEYEVMRRLFDRGKQFEDINRLYFVKHQTQITYIHGMSSSAKYTRLIFDRGRKFDESVSMDKYNDEFVYKLILQFGCGLKLLFTDSNVLEIVKDGDDYYDNELYVKTSQGNGISESISTSLWFIVNESKIHRELTKQMHNCRRCFFIGVIDHLILQLRYVGSLRFSVEGNNENYLSQVLSQTIIRVIWFLSFSTLSNYIQDSIASLFPYLQGLDFGCWVFDRGKDFQYNRYSCYYCFAMVHFYQDTMGYVFIEESTTSDSSKLFYEIWVQVNILSTNSRLHVIKELESSNAQLLVDHIPTLHSWSLHGDIGFVLRQQWIHGKHISSLRFFFQFINATHEDVEGFRKLLRRRKVYIGRESFVRLVGIVEILAKVTGGGNGRKEWVKENPKGFMGIMLVVIRDFLLVWKVTSLELNLLGFLPVFGITLVSSNLRSMENAGSYMLLGWPSFITYCHSELIPLNAVATVCHKFPMERPRRFLRYVILFRETYVPAGELFSHNFLDVSKDYWIWIHAYNLVWILATSRSCLWFLRMGVFVYGRMPSDVLNESHTVREAVMELNFYERRIMRIQLMLSMIHIPFMLFLVVCWKCEFKLFLWGLWGAGNVIWSSVTSIEIHFSVREVYCQKVTLVKEGKVIVLQGIK